MPHIAGSHHATLSVGRAQEDVDFHVGTLGMRFIKKTVLYDGSLPIYHLYYSNAHGDASSVVTTFPFAQAGITGRRGTNQARELHLAVPATSLDFWHERLTARGIDVRDAEVLDQRRLLLTHPCGIEYALVGVEGDTREGFGGSDVPVEHAIHGIHGIGVHVANPENMVEFVNGQFYGKSLAEEGDRVVLDVGEPSRGGAIELVVNRQDDPGTWRFGAGTIHHFAWDMESYENQDAVKFEIEGVGYTDISELKDRTYFKSVYVRTPAGALFELAVTTPLGWATDESPNELGSAFQVPPQFEAQRDDILGQLEQIEIPGLSVDVHAGRPAERWGAPCATARLAVVGLHGRGQSPAYVRGIADRIDLPDLLWTAPAAHDSSWYPGRYTDPQARNEPHLSSALAVVDRARAALAQDGFGPDRVVLLGFSQGACVLAEHLVRGAEPCAAAVLLTGAFLGPPGVARLPAGDLAGMPVLLALPAQDEWVALPQAEDTAGLLRVMGASVVLEVGDEPEHVVTDAAVTSARRLLARASGDDA